MHGVSDAAKLPCTSPSRGAGDVAYDELDRLGAPNYLTFGAQYPCPNAPLFERLRDEYGFTGKITIVKDYICGVRQRRREMFVPLTHPPGHAQVDFGEALAVIGGVERKIHFLAMSLPHSDACFVKA